MLGKIVLYLNIFIGLLPFSVYATNELNISSEVDIQQNKFIQLDNQKENIDSNIQNPAIQLGNSIENQPTGLQNQVVQPEETKERTTSEQQNPVIQLENSIENQRTELQNQVVQAEDAKERIASEQQNPAIQLENSIENQPTGLQNQVVQPEEIKERTTSEQQNPVIQLENSIENQPTELQNQVVQPEEIKERTTSEQQNPAIQLENSIENQPTELQNQVVQPEETKERTTSELRNQVIQLDNQGNSVLPEQQGYSNTINFVKEASSSLGKEVANIDLVNISLIVLLIIVIFAIFILAYPMSKLTNQSETNKTNTTTGVNESIKTNRVDSSMPIEGVDKSVGWHIFHKSLIGKSHLSKNPPIPCQDFNFIKEINEQWGILIVCDGAGSQKYSHKGAKFFAKKVASLMHKYIDNWISMDREDLPDNDTWRRDFRDIIYNVRADSFTYVEMQKEDISDISINNIGCTLILAVYSPYGILSAHIGDGRMGYRDESGWHSMMRPYKGEYANQTVFLNTAYIYDNLDNVNDPTNPYLETRVIKADISAIVLMSDGCEKGLYRTNEKDDNSGKYIEVNKPISLDFFIRDLSSKIDSLGKDSANKFFEQVMREGNESLSNEDDDKTLVLAYPKNKWRGK